MELRDFDLSNHYYELAGQFFDEMNVSEQWTYLNNRGNHYYYRKELSGGFEIYAQGQCTRIFLSADGV